MNVHQKWHPLFVSHFQVSCRIEFHSCDAILALHAPIDTTTYSRLKSYLIVPSLVHEQAMIIVDYHLVKRSLKDSNSNGEKLSTITSPHHHGSPLLWQTTDCTICHQNNNLLAVKPLLSYGRSCEGHTQNNRSKKQPTENHQSY